MTMLSILLFATLVHGQGLDSAIDRAARVHNVSAERLRAIAHLESSSGRLAILKRNKNGTYDIGPFQINSVHWNTTCKAYDISTDHGNAMCAALLLKHAKRHENSDPHWIGRYHSKTPSKKVWYAMKVLKFMKQGSYNEKARQE